MKLHNTIHPDLDEAQTLAYEQIGLTYSKLINEAESHEYGACTFEINNKNIKFRVAKITPIKAGQFVSFWKRIVTNTTTPQDMSDPFDFLVVSVRDGNRFGQFVFPKNVLWQKGFVSKDGKGGKRAMRVYPPWDKTESPQAKRTQAWQILYFAEIQPHLDIAKIQKLLK